MKNVLGVALTLALVVACSSNDLDATSTATASRINNYLEETASDIRFITEVDNAITNQLIELRVEEARPDPNNPRRTQLDSIRRINEPRVLDSMTTEEILEALGATSPLFIPDQLRVEYGETISALGKGIIGLDDTIVRWQRVSPPPEMAQLHSLNLRYFQSLRRYYEASLKVKRYFVENGEINPVEQAKVELALDVVSDNLSAVQAEFGRASSEHAPR